MRNFGIELGHSSISTVSQNVSTFVIVIVIETHPENNLPGLPTWPGNTTPWRRTWKTTLKPASWSPGENVEGHTSNTKSTVNASQEDCRCRQSPQLGGAPVTLEIPPCALHFHGEVTASEHDPFFLQRLSHCRNCFGIIALAHLENENRW